MASAFLLQTVGAGKSTQPRGRPQKNIAGAVHRASAIAVNMGLHGSHGKGPAINPYIWCAVGAVMGWLAGRMAGDGTLTVTIEYVLVGIFGAFIGAEFVSSLFAAAPAIPAVAKAPGAPAVVVPAVFTIGGLAMAVAGATVMLVALSVLRKAVGPMHPHKRKAARRY